MVDDYLESGRDIHPHVVPNKENCSFFLQMDFTTDRIFSANVSLFRINKELRQKQNK